MILMLYLPTSESNLKYHFYSNIKSLSSAISYHRYISTMRLTQALETFVPILALATPALSCVQFSIDYTCPGTSESLDRTLRRYLLLT